MVPDISSRPASLRCPLQYKRTSRIVAMADARSGQAPFNLERKLNEMLEFLKFWDKADSQGAGVTKRPVVQRNNGQMEEVLGPNGVLGWYKWAQKNENNAREAEHQLKSAGRELKKGNWQEFLKNLAKIDLNWLRLPDVSAKKVQAPKPSIVPLEAPAMPASKLIRNVSIQHTILYFCEAICPWDYDRKEPSVTFVNVWTDIDAIQSDRDTTKVKVTSTVKPLHQEWKLTARTKLMSLGDTGVVFGKAGIYLAGDRDPFVGVEADRTWKIPKFPGTSIFANANYRSSRKPASEPVLASAGIQQNIRIRKGLEFTLRVGLNSRDGLSKPFFTPVPFGSYY